MLAFPREQAKKGTVEQTPPFFHPSPSHSLCFSLFPSLSIHYHHFRQLSKVFLDLAKSWGTSSGTSSEGKHFGTACTSSRVPRACMIRASCRGTSWRQAVVTLGYLIDLFFFHRCINTRRWMLNGSSTQLIAKPWEASLIYVLSINFFFISWILLSKYVLHLFAFLRLCCYKQSHLCFRHYLLSPGQL